MLSRGRSVRRSLGVVAAFTALALGPSATSAGADVRSAAVVDAVDPTVAFDITRADVTVDNVSGRLLLVVRLGHQLQAQAGEYPSLTARVSNSTFCPDGGGVDDKVGDTIIKIRPANSPDPSGQRPLEA
ncbi:MAG: hypothetical protein F2817_09545, partial [Actinobacteria bacterium]|nr:hypothetical protein [Actinomycetota bacterium]